jgi:hypothetical protein
MVYVFIGIALLILWNFLIPSKKIKQYGPAKIFLFSVLTKLKGEFPMYKLIDENDGRVKYEFKSTTINFTIDFIYMKNKIQLTISADGNKFHVCESIPYDIDEINFATDLMLRQLQGYSLRY